MRPVAIFQHEADTPPAYFEQWLRDARLPYQLVRIDGGEPVPADPRPFSGLCFMGGSMSVNDPLPWIEPECALIRAADAAGVPVIGHCLGGQLLAKALGAPVTRNAVKEIGWHRVSVTDPALAHDWLGDEAGTAERAEWFQWHGDTFALPTGARSFLGSTLCAHQAYVIERAGFAHLGMQFHCEMTAPLVIEWATGISGRREIDDERARNGGPGVQAPEAVIADVERRAQDLSRLAAQLYARWAQGLKQN